MGIIQQYKLSRQYNTAYELAQRLHFGQKDKSANDYFEHPKYLARMCTNLEDKIVALLHDTIEDTFADYALLKSHGIDVRYITDIVTLSRCKGQSYKKYIE